MLAGQLLRLVEALERVHAARGELVRAAELAAGARAELGAWVAHQVPATPATEPARGRKALGPPLGRPQHFPGHDPDGRDLGR